LQPAARPLLAALGEPAPEIVDLLLGLAMDLERDRLVEFEMRAAVEGDKLLPGDLELRGHDRSRRFSVNLVSLFPVAADPADPGILEDGNVEPRRLLGLRVEPQAGRDLLRGDRHSCPPRALMGNEASRTSCPAIRL